MFLDAEQASAQRIFMTSMSGVDNNAMSCQPDGVGIQLAGLPTYDDVIANSDKYASSFSIVCAVRPINSTF